MADFSLNSLFAIPFGLLTAPDAITGKPLLVSVSGS